MSSPRSSETLDSECLPPSSPGVAGQDRLYLLVLEGDSSSLCPLPRNGSLRIGRSPDAELRVEDLAVSRNHAKVTIADGVAQVVDLKSHNGIRVNGELVEGARQLRSGDVLTLGGVTLVFHCGDRPQPARPLLDASSLRRRLAEELERVQHYERSVGIAALEIGPVATPEHELLHALGRSLRLIDLVGRDGPSRLLVILPELSGDEGNDAVRHLLETLSSLAPGCRAGLATAPQDGMDADALIAAARAAARMPPPGDVRASGHDLHRLFLGERSVVVAEPSMVRIFELLKRLAASPIPVLIHGETGTGKENAAWAVHHWSPRAGGPFVALNCAALPENLVESELFGYEKGAFSGAAATRKGLFEIASGGTLFLDEVAELSLAVQAKLLRALDQKRITRLGDTRERPVDLRIVAATHRVLREEVAANRFRQDLFFRLSAAVVVLPPLRDRPCELPLLAQAFLADACTRSGRPPMQISARAMGAMGAHAWPGNMRELKNTMEFAAATAVGSVLEYSHLPEYIRGSSTELLPSASTEPGGAEIPQTFRPIAEEIRELERRRIYEALEATGGIQTRAAQLIGMPLRTFVFKMNQYGLSPRSRGASVRS